MIPGILILSLAAALGAGPVLPKTPDESPAEATDGGVLILHGGQVLQGKITRTGDLYHVALPGGEIRIRATMVAAQCSTLEEAYSRRREAIHVGNADEHIELARWCQRNGLLSAAARELADAMAANPANPAIVHLERQLKAALAPEPLPTASPATQGTNAPSAGELDKMTRQMPPGSVEAFTSTIQPLLVSSCTAGGCHGPQSEDRFRLLRGRQGQPPSRRITQRNLHATLACIDRKNPEKSLLLTEAIRAHGTAQKPALSDKDQQKYRQIVQWVRLVAAADRAGDGVPPRATNAQRALQGQQRLIESPGEPGGLRPENVSQTASTVAADVSPLVTPLVPGASREPPSRSPVQRGALIEQFVPSDPFDPEIFNRRYHPGDRSQAE